ncbi:MAG TPA: cell division protein FtsB [Arenimonas sp.]|nr:cell division protein FtsB [Arenimonas sp.]
MTRRFWPYVLLIVLMAVLLSKLWFGQGNWRQVEDLRAQVAAQKKENDELLRRNKALAAEVKDLKSGVEAVEERARNEMGMIKPGETFYRVVDSERKLSVEPAENGESP